MAALKDKVKTATTAGLVAGGLNLVLCLGLWFGFSLTQRSRRERRRMGSRPVHA